MESLRTMDLKDYSLITAIAAVGALSWKVYQDKKNRAGHLKLSIRFVETMEIGLESKYTGRKVSLECTNVGVDTRLIEIMGVRIDPAQGLSRYLQLHFVGVLSDFDKRIARGEQRSVSISVSDLTGNPFCKGLKDGDSFRFFVRDTMGKEYLSNPLRFVNTE